MSNDPEDIEKSHAEFLQSNSQDELHFLITELGEQSDQQLHYLLIERKLYENGLNLGDAGIADYSEYTSSLEDNFLDPTYHRLFELMSVLSFLEYEEKPFEEIVFLEDYTAEQLENIFLYTDGYDEVWLKTIRDILPQAEVLKTDNDAGLIDSFRTRSIIRFNINNSINLFKENARTVLDKNYVARFGEHDNKLSVYARLLHGVVAVYIGEGSAENEIALGESRSILRSHGLSTEESMAFLKLVHDQALQLDNPDL